MILSPWSYSFNKELDKLVSSGVLEPVPASDWASPIVVVPKKDGRIQLCGDYKVTINSLLVVDTRPLPKPQELFASLAGGISLPNWTYRRLIRRCSSIHCLRS